MKQKIYGRVETVYWQSRLFFLTVLLLIGIQQQALASGAKMPVIESIDTTTAKDGTVVNTKNPGGLLGSDTGSSGTGSVPPIADEFSHLDPTHEVPPSLLSKTVNYFIAHRSTITNKGVIGIIDFKQHNSKERFYIINMETGQVEKYLVAHGKNSDPDFDGFATAFSNSSGSEASSIGFYLTAETYEGNHGHSLKLDGLSSTNSNARSRAIVIHPADYVTPGNLIGRSWGCPALDPRESAQIINQIKNGALIYATNIY